MSEIKTYKSGDGKEIEISKMNDGHLVNALLKYERMTGMTGMKTVPEFQSIIDDLKAELRSRLEDAWKYRDLQK